MPSSNLGRYLAAGWLVGAAALACGNPDDRAPVLPNGAPAAGSPMGAAGAGDPAPAAAEAGGGLAAGAGTGELLPGPRGPLASPEAEGPCAAVYDPSQLLNYHLQLADADWQALLADTTNSAYFPAEMSCEGGAPLRVALRRKRSGRTTKVGLKVDINRELQGQSFQGLKKLSLESGISEGDGELTARSLLSEYLAWRSMALSGAITGHAAMARVTVNSIDLGVYVNVEQVDKAFLASRLGDDTGWLFKKSGNDSGDGYQTNEGQPNPYAANLCFWDGSGCAQPSPVELATLLPQYLDIEQALRLAAVQALIANTDAFPLKNNNVIFYDWPGGGRLYFPWDLDTTMNRTFDVFSGTVPGGTRRYVDLLFSHWRADYARILAELVNERLTLDVILAELDAILTVAGSALADDPWITGSADDGEQLRRWWSDQHAAVAASVRAL